MASARTAPGPNLATLGQRTRTNDTKLKKKLFQASSGVGRIGRGRDLRGLGCPLSPKDARTNWGADNEWGVSATSSLANSRHHPYPFPLVVDMAL